MPILFSWTPKNNSGTDFSMFEKGFNNGEKKNTPQFLTLMKGSRLIWNICNSGFIFWFLTKKYGYFINPFSPHPCQKNYLEFQSVFYFSFAWNKFYLNYFVELFWYGLSLTLPPEQLMPNSTAYEDLSKVNMNSTSSEEWAQDHWGLGSNFQRPFSIQRWNPVVNDPRLKFDWAQTSAGNLMKSENSLQL